jgi:O-antigen ligase
LKLSAVFALVLVFALGAFAVYRTRTAGAVVLHDDSASLRYQVAKAGAARILIHPFFGVGMDSVHKHWHDWGFPGEVIIHTHSTPLEIAFERGLPALFFWCWILIAFWRITSAAERSFRSSENAQLHGLTLGALGSITGFVASSLVNYNFGDGEVALVFWFLMGTIIAIAPKEITATNPSKRT